MCLCAGVCVSVCVGLWFYLVENVRDKFRGMPRGQTIWGSQNVLLSCTKSSFGLNFWLRVFPARVIVPCGFGIINESADLYSFSKFGPILRIWQTDRCIHFVRGPYNQNGTVSDALSVHPSIGSSYPVSFEFHSVPQRFFTHPPSKGIHSLVIP